MEACFGRGYLRKDNFGEPIIKTNVGNFTKPIRLPIWYAQQTIRQMAVSK